VSEPQPRTTCVILDGALTVRSIDPARASLAAVLAQHDVVTIDCTAATEIDLSLVQLLLAARASALHAGKTLRLTTPAEGPLRAALDRGGFLADLAQANPADGAGAEPVDGAETSLVDGAETSLIGGARADAAFWLAQDEAPP